MAIVLPGYSVNEQLYANDNLLVYSGTRDADKKPVIFKLLKTEHPTPDEILRFKREFEIMKSLHMPDIVQAYSLEKYKHSYAMVLERVEGISLADMLPQKKLTLQTFLELAIQIAEALGQIHHSQIIHKDIKPANILYDPQKKKIKITDFGLSVNLPKEKISIINPNLLEGTLAYLSPEQTGRMNRGIDYRTDYYSLGITYYEMLTGQLPFRSQDPMELIHCHIAVIPKTPHDIAPSIPVGISSVIMKLLAKTAEDRYQSAYGLISDLKTCLGRLQKTGDVPDFKLGSHDIYNQFQIPEKLYGREHEINLLQTSYEHAMQGKAEFMLVEGNSGIGKSTLVYEFYKHIEQKKGYFISGKFEQFKHNIPYAAFTQVFRELITQILTESEEKIVVFREKILHAIGENGQVIIDVIPSIENIIGKQQPVPLLGHVAAQNRFHHVFLNFTQALSGFDHPLVIFFDDLQWADAPSLKLIEVLLTNPDYQYLYIIGAYRSNEVSSIHPLIIKINELKKQQVVCQTLTVDPLQLTDVNELLADTLHQDKIETHDIAQLVYEKTRGNPFFLVQLLQTLYKDNLIQFDMHRSRWSWDIEKIKKMSITDNVVQLMIDKIRQLSSMAQTVIKFAACIGSHFDIDILAKIFNKSTEIVTNYLQEPLFEGLILKRDMYESVSYHFAHDRIQQAAHSLLDQEEQRAIHIELGRMLLKRTSEAQLNEVIFDIVNHFNIGIGTTITSVNNESERKKVAELNLRAGRLAKNAAAFEPALIYVEYGLSCLSGDAWHLEYDLAIKLYAEAAELAYLNARFDLVEKYVSLGVQHSKNIFDELKFIETKISTSVVQSQQNEAISTMLEILDRLGIRVPKKIKFIHILIAIIKIKWLLLGKKITDLLNLPEMTDPVRSAAMPLLFRATTSVYISNQYLFALLTLKSVILSIRYGNGKWSAAAYACYGVMTSGLLGDIETGCQFGELALNLMEHKHAVEVQTSVQFAFYGFICHWKYKLQSIPPKLEENYKTGLESGDLIFAHHSIASCGIISYLSGMPLKDLLPKIQAYSQRLSTLKQDFTYNNLSLIHQAILNLIEQREQPDALLGVACDEIKLINIHTSSSNYYGLFLIYFNKLVLSYLFGKNDNNAVHTIQQVERYLAVAKSSPCIAPYYFYKSLMLLALYPSGTAKKQREIIKTVKTGQKKMHKWASFAACNFAHKYFLVEAELARVQGQTEKAASLYDKAIELANQNDFLNEEAVANELAAKFYLSQHKEKFAKLYMQDARHCYLLWGADAKVAQLDEMYSHLLDGARSGLASTLVSSSTSNNNITSQTLDVTTIQKASQLISSTIILSDLLKELMGIMIENSGAQRSFLLLSKSGKYVIEAEGNVGKQEEKILQSIPATDDILPTSIISYVVHTKEAVILDRASRAGQFVADPYVAKNQIKSVLCMPLLNQGALTGILYLENNLLEGAFTKDHMAVLNILSSQIAISIDNARLYSSTLEFNKQLMTLNKAYERFVPNDFLNLLGKESIVDVALGDQVKKNMTVLFADIRNFTSLSENMTPQENFAFINSFLGHMEPIITKHKGFIDKYIGDAIMALYPASADDAVQCAIEMKRVLHEYNTDRASLGYPPIHIGIGINSGLLMLGTVGSVNRMDGTVISDTVNVASRIEDLTKKYKAYLLITENTYNQLTDPSSYTLHLIDHVPVKGKAKKVAIYQVMVGDTEITSL